jgi:hypothetical protein
VNIPDYIMPVVGYRVWSWDAIGLKSLNGELWMPGQSLSAACRKLAGRAEHGYVTHEAPHEDCTCGVYSAKSLDHLRTFGYMQYGIYGEVWLWGTVVEHQLGWRAQFAYPKKLVLPIDTVPLSMGAAESRLTTLSAYSCDIFVHGKTENVPLWLTESGYDAVGLDLLIQRSKVWYSRRAEERRIKPGDRVAVLGHGIAVVEQADHNQVHAALWNRDMVRIERGDICWDEQNMRWEAAVVAGKSEHRGG